MKPFFTRCVHALRQLLTAPAAADVTGDRVLLAARLPSACQTSWSRPGEWR